MRILKRAVWLLGLPFAMMGGLLLWVIRGSDSSFFENYVRRGENL